MPRPPGHPGRARAAFTLVEVVLALALILAIGALVLPTLDSGSVEWRQAQRFISMAAVETRAMAMHDGRPMQLLAHPTDAGFELRATPISEPLQRDEPAPAPAPGAETLGVIPRSARLIPGASAPSRSSSPPAASSASPDPSLISPGSDVLLLTALPSGQTALAPNWCLGFGDTIASASINSWTGEVTFTPTKPASSPTRDQDSPQPDPQDSPTDSPPP